MRDSRKLSIIIPVFNEENTIEESLRRVIDAKLGKWQKEIIIVDDGSKDKSRQKIKALLPKLSTQKVKFIVHKKNKGKGVAIQTGLKYVTGDAFIVQDADLEYDPNDISRLIKELEKGKAQIIFGSRQAHVSKKDEILYVWGINLSTTLINLLYGSKLSDVWTCYKLCSQECLDIVSSVKSRSFEWDMELIVKLLKAGFKINEIPINYQPRTFSEGKKIRAWHGLKGLWIILKYRF